MEELVLALPVALRGHGPALRAQAARWIPDAADAFYLERTLSPAAVQSDTLDLLFRVDWARGTPASTAAVSDPYLARCTAWRARSQLAAACSSYIWFELDRLHELSRADAAPGVSVCVQRGFGRGGADRTALPRARLASLYQELEEIYGGAFQGARAVTRLLAALPAEASLLHASVMGGRRTRRYKLYLTLPRGRLAPFLEQSDWQGPRTSLAAHLAQLQAEVGGGPEARLRIDLAFDAQLHPYLGLEFFAPRVPPVDPTRSALLGELRALGLIGAAEIDALTSWCGSSRKPLGWCGGSRALSGDAGSRDPLRAGALADAHRSLVRPQGAARPGRRAPQSLPGRARRHGTLLNVRRRTRWLAWLAWLSIAASACGAAHHPARDPGPDAGSLPLCPSPPPPDQPLALDSRLPCDIGPASAPDGGVTDRSAQFATFSWNSFIALMWPTDAQGRAAPALGRYDPAWPAWTHWTSRRSFDLGEQPPVASAPVPRVLSDADIDQVVPADIAGSVLWDRSLRPVYYEVVYNSDLAQVIQAQKLGSLAQQLARWSPRTLQVTLPPTPQALGPLLAPTPVGTLVPGTSAGRWVFQAQDTGATTCLDTFQSGVDQLDVYPATWQSGSWFRGGLALPWGNPARTPPSLGSVVLKLAWKVLDPEAGDISARFLHLPATIVHGDQRQEHVEVGLVGLHIAHKTLSAMTWAWSTFEHIDNVPLETGRPTTERTYTFYDPHCRDCPVNTPSTTPRASQLLRVLPIDPGTRALNERAARQLAALDTVLAYYRLVGTQWPTDPGYAAGIAEPCLTSDLAPAPSGKPSPAALTNPVIESFTQEASCMDCHARASIASARAPGGRALFERPGSADFLFLFRHAP